MLLALVAWLFEGIRLEGALKGGLALVFTGIILGLLNAFLRPILILFTLPLTILTLGLFIFVINALLFWLTSELVSGFRIDGFFTALLASLVYSALSFLSTMFLSDKGKIEMVRLGKKA
jgi:putative membrane protein